VSLVVYVGELILQCVSRYTATSLATINIIISTYYCSATATFCTLTDSWSHLETIRPTRRHVVQPAITPCRPYLCRCSLVEIVQSTSFIVAEWLSKTMQSEVTQL